MDLGFDYFPWGAGARNKLKNITAENDVPIIQNPHSTYLERFYLHGAIGLLSLALFIYLVINSLIRIRESDLSFDDVYYVFYLFWSICLFMSINDDLLRYRLIWVMLAITMGIATVHAKKKI